MTGTKPLILAAANAPTLLKAALTYELMGFSVLPCEGKKASINWNAFQYRAAHPMTIRKWDEVGLLQNVALLCGEVSGNLVVVDCDGKEAMRAFEERFPHLANNTYAVLTGSGNGAHWYFRAHRLPPTTRVIGASGGNIELRANGCYVVAPPSIHPDTGKPYRPLSSQPVLTVDNLHPVVEWIKSIMREKHGGKLPPATGTVKNASAWARAALAAECALVRGAPYGARNSTLYIAALKMGSLIADGKLDRVTVEQALFNAAGALSATDGESATIRTITSGINRGLESSRERFNNRA